MRVEMLEPRQLFTVLFVDAASAAGDGSSWVLAFPDLQSALSAATAGDSIHIAQGIYTPTTTTSRTVSFSLKNGVEVLGGYAGAAAADPDVRDVTATPTVLSGDIGATGNASDNSYHVVANTGLDATAVLDGVTIRDGNATGDSQNGGGMENTNAAPTIRNVMFLSNSANQSGGAVYNSNGNPTFDQCTFTGNATTGTADGGAMYNSSSSPATSNCTFSGNQTSSLASGGAIANFNGSSPTITDSSFSDQGRNSSGGAIYNLLNSSPTLLRCTFTANQVTSSGGAIYNGQNSSPTLTDCTFTGNTSLSTGGAVFNVLGSVPTVTGCTFTSNTGGAFVCDASSGVMLSNSTFTKNTGGALVGNTTSASLVADRVIFSQNVGAFGGAAVVSGQGANFTNCVFSGNTATAGGAVDSASGATVSFLGCVFVGNSATTFGGAVYNDTGVTASIINCTFAFNKAVRGGAVFQNGATGTVVNSIFQGNTVTGSATESQFGGSAATVSQSLVQGGITGSAILTSDPKFTRAAAIGADNVWGTADDDYGDLSLLSGSPAIGAGSNAAVPTALTTDVTGASRIVNTVDLGAYESVFSDSGATSPPPPVSPPPPPTSPPPPPSGGGNANLTLDNLKVKLPKPINGVIVGGATVSGSISLNNAGSAAASGKANFNIYLSADAAVSGDDVLLAAVPPVSVNLKAGKHKTQKFTATLPTGLSGSKQLLVSVTPDSAIAESSGADNSVASAPFALQAPTVDLAVASVKNAKGKAGKSASISVSLRNNGNSVFNGTVPVRLTLTGADSVALAALDVASVLKKLAPGKRKTLKFKLLIPAAIASGSGSLAVVADPDNTLGDANLSNNTGSGVLALT